MISPHYKNTGFNIIKATIVVEKQTHTFIRAMSICFIAIRIQTVYASY